MGQWDIAALLGILGAVGGGLRWFFGWLDRRAEDKHRRAMELESAKAALATRVEAIEDKYLAVIERHRTEHLADTKLFATTLAALKRTKSDPPSSP